MTATKTTNDTTAPVLLTVAEACEVLRISRWLFYRLMHERQIETLKLGNRRLVPQDALRRLVDAQIEDRR